MKYIKYSGVVLSLFTVLISLNAQAQDVTQKKDSVITTKGNAPEDEYVNIPFGKRTKRELNYAVSSMNTESLPQSPLSNLSSVFAGRLSGLYVQTNGYQPGTSNTSFLVRGKSTYSDAGPVVLVDGVARDFVDMDMNEIESITVLKDAASLSWYGLNAGNGAILINTRHGKPMQNFISLDVQTGFQQTDNLIKPLNAYDYATLYNQGQSNVGQAPAFSQTALDAYQSHSDLYRYPDNNYIDRFLNKVSPLQRYSLSFGGGSNKVQYYSVLSFYDQPGLFKETKTDDYNSNFDYKRFNFRVNLDYEVTPTLTVSLLGGLRSEIRSDVGNSSASVFNLIYNLPPTAFPISNADGTYGGTSVYQENPLGMLQSTGYSRVTTNALLASLSAKQKLDFITKGLSANVFFSYDGYGDYTDGLTKNYNVVDQTVTPAQTYRTAAVLAYRSAAFGTNTKNNELWVGLDYDRTFAQNHKITVSARAQQSVSAAIDRIDYRGRMLVARADYGFKNRYFLGFTGSYSGTENYASDRRFGFFPAASAGWVTSDESFFKAVKFIDYLKFRASYGRTGNEAPTYDSNGNRVRLPYRSLFTRGAGPILGTSFSGTTTAYEISPAGNMLTTWEKIDRLNVGTDVRVLNNALSLSADYFHDLRTDILGNANAPGILGVELSQVNSGKVRSEGVDLSGIYEKQINKVQIALNANFTYAKNTVLARSSTVTMPYQSTEGFNVGSKSCYISQGIFQSQAEIDASPTQTLSGLVVPGDIKYKDINEDGVINSNDVVATNYTDIPNIYYGFGCSVKYKIFDVSMQFQGIHGRTIDINSIVHSGPNGLNQLSKDSWTAETAATAKYPRIGITDNGNNTASSDFWLRSGDFLKLRTIELGISTPQRFHFIKSARLYVAGYNLLTFSKVKDLGIDPEAPSAGRGTSYPFVRTFTVGLNVKF
ncbi:MAG: SusC/RagA family TonB-linked outer membrane protein [Bacteroidota bacterium]|nr:SusC/RagA family TonB-linked outer membrane protein [Bacteroidota bacterium]